MNLPTRNAWQVLAGIGVFIGVTMLIADWYPDLAYAMVGLIALAVILSHSDGIVRLLGNYQTSMGATKSGK